MAENRRVEKNANKLNILNATMSYELQIVGK